MQEPSLPEKESSGEKFTPSPADALRFQEAVFNAPGLAVVANVRTAGSHPGRPSPGGEAVGTLVLSVKVICFIKCVLVFLEALQGVGFGRPDILLVRKVSQGEYSFWEAAAHQGPRQL